MEELDLLAVKRSYLLADSKANFNELQKGKQRIEPIRNQREERRAARAKRGKHITGTKRGKTCNRC